MAVEIDSQSAEAYYGRCLLLVVRNDPEGAMKNCHKAVQLDPKRRPAVGEYKMVARDLENWRDRRVDLNDIDKGDPRYLQIRDDITELEKNIQARLARLQSQLMPRPDAPAPS